MTDCGNLDRKPESYLALYSAGLYHFSFTDRSVTSIHPLRPPFWCVIIINLYILLNLNLFPSLVIVFFFFFLFLQHTTTIPVSVLLWGILYTTLLRQCLLPPKNKAIVLVRGHSCETSSGNYCRYSTAMSLRACLVGAFSGTTKLFAMDETFLRLLHLWALVSFFVVVYVVSMSVSLVSNNSLVTGRAAVASAVIIAVVVVVIVTVVQLGGLAHQRRGTGGRR